MQRLENPVPALEPLGRQARGAARETHEVGQDPPQAGPGNEPQQGLGVADQVGLHGGQAAQAVEADAGGGAGQARDGREEQEPVAQTKRLWARVRRVRVRVRARVLVHVPVKDFDADIRPDGVAHENDKVVRRAGAGPARGHVAVHGVYLGVNVQRRVVRPKGLVVVVAEAGEVAAVQVVHGLAVPCVEQAAQRAEEVHIEANEAWVAADKVDEGTLLGRALSLRRLPYRG